MKQAPLIEGFRAYLAFWVVFDHLLGVSGYPPENLSGIFKIVRSGWYAVDIFIIISGFVIFYLLDNKQESYFKFITRRFFRLWPLFISLFIVSIPLSLIYISNTAEFALLFPNTKIGDGFLIARINSWWENIFLHIFIHIPMLHGIIPNSIIPNSPDAFLVPAWSISLEWQFYLIAPLVFKSLKSGNKWSLFVISMFTIILFIIGKRIDNIQFGAFLPMHIEFFFIGCLSYFIYKALSRINLKITFFPINFVLASFLLINSNFNMLFLPYIVWIIFFSLLIDFSNNTKPLYISYISYLFQNRLVVYLGKISYSIYLSHSLVIIIQYLIIGLFPALSQKYHLIVLTIGCCFFTIFISHFTYKYIELYYMKKGNLLTSKIKH